MYLYLYLKRNGRRQQTAMLIIQPVCHTSVDFWCRSECRLFNVHSTVYYIVNLLHANPTVHRLFAKASLCFVCFFITSVCTRTICSHHHHCSCPELDVLANANAYYLYLNPEHYKDEQRERCIVASWGLDCEGKNNTI